VIRTHLVTRHVLGYDDAVKKRARGAEDETLQAYLREISTFPPLTSAEERHLGRRIRRHRDQYAFRRLVESNLRFVVGYARRYRGLGVVFLDLIDEANLGLMEAARRYDPERNFEFIAYAQWWIRQAIMHALADQGRVFAVPRRTTPVARTLQGGELSSGHRTSFAEDGDQFRGCEPDAHLFEDVAVRHAIIDQVRDVLFELSPREREVMHLRFGLDGGEPLTVQATGLRLGVSRERVRQLEGHARRKLRRSQKSRELRCSLN
jgi:RNA polymerase primary sigma factor